VGEIVATLDDYEAVYDLIFDLVADVLEASVPADVRETVEAVAERENPKGFGVQISDAQGVSLPALAKHMDLDKGTVSRRVGKAMKGGYLYNLEDRKGKPARVVLGDPLPEEMEVLPHPSKLRDDRCTVAA